MTPPFTSTLRGIFPHTNAAPPNPPPRSGGRSPAAVVRRISLGEKRPGDRGTLQPSRQGKNQHDQQDQADSAEGIVTPSRTVTPTWKRADEEKNEDNKQDIAHEARVG